MGRMPHFSLLGPRDDTILTLFPKLECGEKQGKSSGKAIDLVETSR